MAKAFQVMLECFCLTEKILAINTDNATPNDKQTTKLSQLNNSFEEENRAQCFNHTVQLSAKTLLKPFNAALGKMTVDDKLLEKDDYEQLLPEVDGNEEDKDKDGEEIVENKDDVNGDINELEELSKNKCELLLQNTAVICATTVTKVYDYETEDVHLLPSHLPISTGLSTLVCNHQFNNNRSPGLVLHLLQTGAQGQTHPL